MNTRRPGRDDTPYDRRPEDVVLASATLRTGESQPAKPHPDDRISLFWRVFGGTLLSIGALIAVTLYNNQANSITELRAEVSRLNEARAELVKKEEFNSRTQNVWDRVQSLQELRATVTGLKEQIAGYGEKAGDLKAVQDKLTQVEARLKAAEDDHRGLMKAELAVTALEQKAVARDAQLKAAEDDRKEMARQLQELRERLAKVEGATEVKPMPKTPAVKDKGE